MLGIGYLYHPSNPENMEDTTPLINDKDVRQRSLVRAEAEREGTAATTSTTSAPEPNCYQKLIRKLANDRRFILLLVILFLASLVLFLTAMNLNTVPRADPSLRKAYVIFRHGTRAPGFTYKNDPYNRENPKYWPNGPGELTTLGKIEAYELGERLRERYRKFLGDYYKPKEFRAFTTLIERTIMSAQLVVASLFQPVGYQAWSSHLNWQPVPVYPNEYINATHGSSCPRFALEFKNSVKNLQNQPSDFGTETEVGRVLQENAGEPDAVPISLFTRVWDTVYFQDRANLPIPDWLKSIYPEKMSVTAVKYLKFYLAASPTQELLVLDPFGRAITNFFTQSPRKMEVHSLHDIHIMGLFLLLGVDSNTYPEPGCAISIELHEKNGGQYIEVYYYPTPKDKKPTQMRMPCGMSCPVSDVIKRFKAYEVENYEQLCQDGEGGVPTHITEFKLHF